MQHDRQLNKQPFIGASNEPGTRKLALNNVNLLGHRSCMSRGCCIFFFFLGGAANGGVYLVAHVKKLLNHMAGDKPAGTRHKRYGIRHGRIRRVYRFWLSN